MVLGLRRSGLRRKRREKPEVAKLGPISDAIKAAAAQQTVDAPAQVEFTGPEIVDVTMDEKSGCLWVNVNGVCVLRVHRAKHLKFIALR